MTDADATAWRVPPRPPAKAWRAIARATLGGWRGRGGGPRALLAGLAIALGVALGFAVQLVNHTALAEFAAGLATLSGDADLEVRGGRDGFDEALYARLAREPAIAVASPVVEVDASLPGSRATAHDAPAITLRLVGIDALRARLVTPALLATPGGPDSTYSPGPLDLLRPGVVFLDRTAMTALHVREGDTIRLQSGITPVALRVAGTVSADAGGPTGVMDIAALQDAFARDGRLTRIDLRLRPGHDVGTVAAHVATMLPPGVHVATPASRVDATARFTRAYRANLDVLALVALFTGGLLVFSTQALAVVRRRSAFALLRSLGLGRRALVALLVGEGALLGVAGALAGVLAGLAVASLALQWFGVDLGAGMFRGRAAGVVMDWPAALAFGAAGVGAAALGSLVPALEAARANPAGALKAGDIDLRWHGPRDRVVGIAAIIAGAACTQLPPWQGIPLAGYASIALLLLGTLRLLPDLSAVCFALLPSPRRVPARLALARLTHMPAQATLSLAALVAAVALMVAMGIMVASFRGSLDAWLHDVLPADLYVRAGRGQSAWFPASLVARVRSLPGVVRVETSRSTTLALRDDAPPVSLLAREIDPAHAEARLALRAAQPIAEVNDAHPAWISEAVADREGWHPGDRVMLPVGGRAVAFTIAGVFRDYARQQGAIVVPRRDYVALTGDADADELALWLAPDASAGSIEDALAALMPHAAPDVATPAALRRVSLAIFDRTFAVTYALEGVAVLIGLAGLSSAFGAQVLMRRRELGMLRHAGLTRGQVSAMLATEGLALAAFGVVLGLSLGFVSAQILIRVVNRQSFHWTMELHVPWTTLALLAAVLVALGMLTAWLAGRRALRGDMVRAVREDW
jgi:putative ABC transport system permease protein